MAVNPTVPAASVRRQPVEVHKHGFQALLPRHACGTGDGIVYHLAVAVAHGPRAKVELDAGGFVDNFNLKRHKISVHEGVQQRTNDCPTCCCLPQIDMCQTQNYHHFFYLFHQNKFHQLAPLQKVYQFRLFYLP